MEEDQALWREVIYCKYGQDTKQCSNEANIPYGVSVWRSIRSLWDKVAMNMKLKVGNGTRIYFWKDIWIGQETLKHAFPDLFSFCSDPDITLASSWSNSWDISFRRNLIDWEIGRVAELLNVLQDFQGLSTRVDTISWKHTEDRRFSVNRLYRKEV